MAILQWPSDKYVSQFHQSPNKSLIDNSQLKCRMALKFHISSVNFIFSYLFIGDTVSMPRWTIAFCWMFSETFSILLYSWFLASSTLCFPNLQFLLHFYPYSLDHLPILIYMYIFWISLINWIQPYSQQFLSYNWMWLWFFWILLWPAHFCCSA